MNDKKSEKLKQIIDHKNIWDEPLFLDVIENYLCIKKYKGRFEIIHDHAGIRISVKWSGTEITKKLLYEKKT